jgi:hypothetical protein
MADMTSPSSPTPEPPLSGFFFARKDPMQATESAAAMAAKLSPPAAVGIAPIMGITLPELVQIAALVYTILMIVHKVWHMWKEWRTGRAMPESEGEML